MKYLTILLINFYQQYLSLFLKNILGIRGSCRFSPSCSEFAKKQIKENGLFLGGYNFFVRFLKCQPFYRQNII
ncbi:MAG: membrane protein insertion efficiency factor YidD [Candidatus Levybacteria bacterium]|nr:membrane protein insertion efficiency factor YidD [Candidatus Levybacteria bacterium]